MIDNELIKEIIKEVMDQLKKTDLDKINSLRVKKKILVVVNGGNKSIDQVFLELKRISTSYDIGVFMSESSEEIIGKDRFERYRVLEKKESAMEYLERSEIILLPFLTKNSCAKVSVGILDTPATYIIGKALLKEKEVIALYDSCIAPGESIFAKKLNKNIMNLREYGINFLTSKELADYIFDKRNSNINLFRNKKVINYQDIKEIRDSSIEISKEAVITPLAREIAKENKIVFVVIG